MSAPAQITEAEACEGANCNDLPYANTTAFAPPPIPPPPMVEVTSPSNLREGYTFDAIHNGQIFSVIVPSGGVKSGQTFQVPFVPNNNNNNVVQVEEVEAVAVPYDDDQFNSSSETTPILPPVPTSSSQQYQHQQHDTSSNNNNNCVFIPTNNVALGVWSTELCDCCAEEYCCHASSCNALFFPFILMGQVLTRMKLSWCGNTSIGHEYKRSTCYWILLTVGYIAIRISLRSCPTDYAVIIEDILDDDDMFDITENIKKTLEKTSEHCSKDNNNHTLNTVTTIWFFLTMYVLIKLRRKVRNAYQIRQSCPCEDCVVSVVCSCCTVSQLARQTADYHQNRAYCCTDTGLAEGVVEFDQQHACSNHTNPNHHGNVDGQQHIV